MFSVLYIVYILLNRFTAHMYKIFEFIFVAYMKRKYRK